MGMGRRGSAVFSPKADSGARGRRGTLEILPTGTRRPSGVADVADFDPKGL